MNNQEILNKIELAALKEIEKFGLPYLFAFNSSNEKGLEVAQKLNADLFVV